MPDKYRMSAAERDLLIRTVIGEAAGQPEEGQAAVAHVVMNRLRSGRHGVDVPGVVLARGQFEPWATRPRELMAISPRSPQYRRVGELIDQVAGGDITDPTNGATHFLEENIVRRRRGGSLPPWAAGQGLKIGDHTFYRPGGALPYADEGAEATTAPRQSGERTETPSAGQNDPIRVAQAPSQSDLAETLRQAGVTLPAPAGVPAEPAVPAAPSDAALAETLRQAGIQLGASSQPVPKPAALPEPKPAKLGPQLQAEAVRQADAMGPMSAVVEGMPLVGPSSRALAAMTGAAFPSTDSVPGATFGDRLRGNSAVLDEAQRLYSERNPRAEFVGNLLGSTALTGAGAMTAPGRFLMGLTGPSTASKVYQGILGGGALSSADAWMRGDNALTGLEAGAVGGAAGPIAGSILQNTVSGAGRALPGRGPLRGLNAPARDRLMGALEGETAESLRAGRERAGPAGFLADTSTGFTDVAGGIADIPGPGKTVMREALRQRDLGQRGRIDAALTQAIGPHTDIEAFKNFTVEARKAAADPLYEAWRSMEVKPTKELAALIPRLDEAGAFKMAEELSGISGRRIDKNFFTPGPKKNFPTTETWDYVKRGLDRRIDQAYAGGDKTLARELVTLKHDLIDEIGKTDAGHIWKQARQEFASRSAILDQIEAGRDTFIGGRSGTDADELRHELMGLSGPELAARLQGARSAIDRVMGDTMRGDTTLRNKLLAPNNQAKLRLLIGDDRANELVRTLEQEKFLKEQSQNIAHGSQTTPKKERVNALLPPPTAPRHFSVTEPATWIPNQFNPFSVAGAWHQQRHAQAVQQLAPLMVTPENQLDQLLAAVSREGRRRSRIEGGAGAAGNLLSAAISGPGTTAARRYVLPTQ